MVKTVLAVDDDPAILRQLESRLGAAGYSVQTATTGTQGLRIFQEQSPKIVITNLVMPELNGFELCRAIRATQAAKFVYILVVSSHSETSNILEAFEAGANDFLSKPFDQSELLARLHAGTRVIQLEEELAQDRLTIHKANTELMVLNKKLQEMATTDELTELPNRREAIRLLGDMWAMAKRQSQPLSCMMIDIDHFKNYNDQYGHEAGDAVLRSTANMLRSVVRAEETVCRLGGEEFVVLCPLSTVKEAMAGAERIRHVVESNKVKHGSTAVAVTISIGVAEKNSKTNTAEALLNQADAALYVAKRSGRNCVCTSEASQLQPLADQSVSTGQTSSERHGHQQEVVRILVVDDDALVRQMCRSLLQEQRFEVIEARDGQEGLIQVRQAMPDLVLMDVEMPKMDGLACVQHLKKDELTRHIPIMMISARAEKHDFEDALEVGVDEYITKPFLPKEFLFRIESVLRLHRGKAELLHSNAVCTAQARGLSILLNLARRLTDCTDRDEALDVVIAATSELTLSQRISIMLPDETGKYLTVAKSIGMDEEVARKVRVPIGGNTAGQVFQSQEPVWGNSPQQAVPKGQNQYDSQFFVSAPMISRTLTTADHVVGVLNVTNRYDSSSFNSLDVESIDLICNIAASAVDVIESHKARDSAQNAIMIALAKLAEHRDDDTGKHLDRVTQFSRMLGEELGARPQYQDEIDQVFLHNLVRAVPLHDIGKVAIPDAILLKPSRLTVQEMDLMKTHVEVGANIIRTILQQTPNVSFLLMALDIILGHHEKYNGKGYPRGVSGDEIPLSARIVAVADVYDALTTSRPYKDPYPHTKAVEIICSSTGVHFDPVLIEAFVTLEKDFQKLAIKLGDHATAADLRDNILGGQKPFLADAG